MNIILQQELTLYHFECHVTTLPIGDEFAIDVIIDAQRRFKFTRSETAKERGPDGKIAAEFETIFTARDESFTTILKRAHDFKDAIAHAGKVSRIKVEAVVYDMRFI